jgi:hypothetical protein
MKTIQEFTECGLSVIPVNKDKIPLYRWDDYKTRIASPPEYENWNFPIAIIGGQISGGVVCIDFDSAGLCFKDWMKIIEKHSPELLTKFVIQQTPSGGYHVVYRCPETNIRNKKLAVTVDNKVLIETRGEGGYFLASPSVGYTLLENDFDNLKNISLEDHEALIEYSRFFNKKFTEIETPKTQNDTQTEAGDVKPFDDYDSKNDPIALLTECGWTVLNRKNDTVYLRRPNKNKGISASWNAIPNRFYVFSTSTDFENEHIYKASAVYTVLKHRGNWTEAAKDLYALGYGTRKKGKPNTTTNEQYKPEVKRTIKTYRAKDFKDRIINFYNNGHAKGVSTGLESLDKYYVIAKGQLNIVSGVPSHGKSEWLDFVLVNIANKNKWKFLIYSPENYPIEFHFTKLAEKVINCRFKNFTMNQLNESLDFVHEHFEFIEPPDDGISIEEILETAKDKKIDGLVIDPWNEMEHMRPDKLSETEYIGNSLSTLRRFARKNNIVIWVVAHPTKLKKDDQGKEFLVPSLYDISGSANWYNKADNGIIVWRKLFPPDEFVDIHVQKIKFKYYGTIGKVQVKYCLESGRYEDITEETLWNAQ